jgi:hypothetical protein
MSEKWELCYVDTARTPISVIFGEPGKNLRRIELGKYADSLGYKKRNLLGGLDWDNIYPYLLDDGWEPFSSYGQYNNCIMFRRKVSS